MPTLFLSYSTQDATWVSSLLTHLRPVAERQQLTIFKDDLSILAGDRWQQVLEQELNRATVMVAVVSADALASTWCQQEWARADERGILLVPILLRDVHLPPEHPILRHQPANRDEAIVVAGAFLDRVAAQAAARVEAALVQRRPAPDLPEPSAFPPPPPWNLPPFADPDHGRPDHHPPPATRWVRLQPDGAQVRITWLGDGRTLHTHTAPATPPPVIQRLARDPTAVSEHELRNAGDDLFAWLLPEAARPAVLGARSPADTPVRLRVHNEVEALAAVPWRILCFAGRWLVQEARWTVEESDEAAPIDVRTGHGDRIGILAPFAEPEVQWLIERLRDQAQITLRMTSPDGYVAVAGSEHELRTISPRSLLLVLAPVEVEGDELYVRLQTPGGGARLARLADLTPGPVPQLLYLHDLDPSGRPLPASLRQIWPCIVRPGIKGSPRDQGAALLHFLHRLLACGCDPVVAALHPPEPQDPSAAGDRAPSARAPTADARRKDGEAPVLPESAFGRAALSMLRVWTRHSTWTVENDRLEAMRTTAEIHIDRKGQRAEAWTLLREMLQSPGWHTTHALVLGEPGDHLLELVGRQIVSHLRHNLAADLNDELHVIAGVEPRLAPDLDLERPLLTALPGRGPLDQRLEQLAHQAPPRGRTLLIVDWGLASGTQVDSRSLRAWLRLSHGRLAPICERLQGRLLIFHVLTAAADTSLRDKVLDGLGRLIPFAERHAGVRARVLPELTHVSRDDVRQWLREHAPWAPEPHEAVAASIIERTQGRFRGVVRVLEDGLKFGFRHDLKRGLELLASESSPTDW